MITGWDIYWITRLDHLQWALSLAFGILIIVSVVWWIIIEIRRVEDECTRVDGWFAVISMTLLPVLLFGLVFTPSTKEMAAIYLLPKIVNNEKVQNIPDKALQLLNAKLDQWVKETLSKKKEEGK